jgi:hypothetical protein
MVVKWGGGMEGTREGEEQGEEQEVEKEKKEKTRKITGARARQPKYEPQKKFPRNCLSLRKKGISTNCGGGRWWRG